MRVHKSKRVSKSTTKTGTGTQRMYIKNETHVSAKTTGPLYKKTGRATYEKGRYIGGASGDPGGIKTNAYYTNRNTHSFNTKKVGAGAAIAGVAAYQINKRRQAKKGGFESAAGIPARPMAPRRKHGVRI